MINLDEFRLPLWKRFFDIVFTLAALAVLIFPMLILYILILVTSKGNPVYKAKRVGANYHIFDFYKFRSMYVDADKEIKQLKKDRNQYTINDEKKSYKPKELEIDSNILISDDMDISDVILVSDDENITEEAFLDIKTKDDKNAFVKVTGDPRVTPVGRVIRKYSIDELPQLFNILKGDMSIVGNRPLPLYEAEKLTNDHQIERFNGPAGLTGLWQVEKRGSDTALSPDERIALDVLYVRKFNFALDIKIIFKTFTAFIQKSDV